MGGGDGEQASTPDVQRVERTGLALVHEGERIHPAEGYVAPLSPVGGGSVVNYYFPVEIEIIGDASKVVEQLCEELRKHIEAVVV